MTKWVRQFRGTFFLKEYNFKFKKNISPLILGYILGQGSVLAIQVLCSVFGKLNLSATMAVGISIWSLAFQFSDLGNSNRLQKYVNEKEDIRIAAFLFTRTVASVIACSLLYFSMVSTKIISHSTSIYFIFLSQSALSALTTTCFLERAGRYGLVAFINWMPWALIAVYSFACLAINHKFEYSEVGILLIIVHLCQIYLTRLSSKLELKFSWHALKAEVSIVFGIIFTSLVGQLISRLILFVLAMQLTVEALGAYASVRGIQTGVSVLLILAIRPTVVRCFGSIEIIYKNNSIEKIKQCINQSKNIFFISMAAAFIGLLIDYCDILSNSRFEEVGKWLPLMSYLPLILLNYILQQFLFAIFDTSIIYIIASLGYFFNIAFLLYFAISSPVLAVVVSEVAQFLVFIFSVLYFLKVKKNG